MPEDNIVTMDQLRIGLYVVLDLSWFQHPFAFSQFKIKSEDQIRDIRNLGLKTVRYNPALSDMPAGQQPAAVAPVTASSTAPEPGAEVAGTGAAAAPVPESNPEIQPALAAKRALVERIRTQREAAARVETAFVNAARAIRDIERNLYSNPRETVQQATHLVTQISDSILCAPDLAIHVMGDRTGDEELYFHSLNVAMLSMMIARDIGVPQEVFGALGMGALLHDIGRKEVPDKILLKAEPLTQAERNLYQMHCRFGVEIGRRLQLSAPVLDIIQDHHEMFDGTGYPAGLKGDAIGIMSRIVAVANYYDELCNPVDVASALTPHDALSTMFAKLRSKFDPRMLQAFIRCLGVYPPGTIVQLSNGPIAMVATVNTAKPMKPVIVIYDENIPKEESILVDLAREQDLNIAKAIRPAQVPVEIYNYLSPRKRVSYYFDAGKSGQETVAR
ncbi:HD-GYP domain-containing protein [Aromatoleum toluclasticum]|uniref:HD-GYP domain-containing protein n=1 Tax=Aromatoleum toluclasticum TaxID=92003 RepID=UPI001D188AFA|nr:HD-GYP domain-containing protein [Aromatoleum toluclasticum]MCC4114226.1 HD-GYP domain-containing protein [Aromatoleum toluclasticum]